MNALQDSLARAAGELGIKIVINQAIDLSGNCKFLAPILFPQFGASKGTLVLNSDDNYAIELIEELRNLGFTASSFLPPEPDEKFDIDSYIEMFSDWGWTGSEESRPKWLLEFGDSDM